MKKLLFLAAFFVPLGAGAISISVGLFQLSPFRACLICAIILHISKYKINKQIMIRKNSTGYTLAFMFVWLLYAVFSFFWAKDISLWLKNVYFLFSGVASIALFFFYLRSVDEIKKAAVAFEMGVLVQCVIGWYEIATRNYMFIEMTEKATRLYINGSERIPIAMQFNPNNFATMMFCGAVIAFFLFINEERKIINLFYFLLGCNCILLLFLTTSRANIIGLLIATTVFFLLKGKKGIVTIAALLVVALFVPKTMELINKVLQFSWADSQGSDSIRINLIKTGLMYVAQTFGFGVGAGQIECWISIYGSPYDIGGIINLHNWWVELITDYGVLVLIGYIVFYVKVMLVFFKNRNNKNARIEKTSLVLFAALCGFVVASTSPSSMIGLEWFWIFLAIIVAYMSLVEKTAR